MIKKAENVTRYRYTIVDDVLRDDFKDDAWKSCVMFARVLHYHLVLLS